MAGLIFFNVLLLFKLFKYFINIFYILFTEPLKIFSFWNLFFTPNALLFCCNAWKFNRKVSIACSVGWHYLQTQQIDSSIGMDIFVLFGAPHPPTQNIDYYVLHNFLYHLSSTPHFELSIFQK